MKGEDGFENLRDLVREIGQDIRNLYQAVFELQDRVSTLEQVATPNATAELDNQKEQHER